jgi:hypothetical protein
LSGSSKPSEGNPWAYCYCYRSRRMC